jgi:hypothetical protein
MPNKTFYVPDRDKPLWDAAQRIAKRDGISLYRVVADALESHLPAVATAPPPEDRWAHIAADQTVAA